MEKTSTVTLADLRKKLAKNPGIEVHCTGNQYTISVYDSEGGFWRHHPQPYWMDEHDTIRKALR